MIAVMAGAPAEPGRRHECGRVQWWSPSRKIPARAPPAEASRFQWPLGNGHGTAGNYISQRPLETRGFRWWRSGRNLPSRAPPLHSPAFMPAPRLSWGARECGKAHRGQQRKEARPLHSITFMPAPRLCRCARHYGNHIEASNATRPAAVINLN
ncbi:hypothetical protein NDU88_008912 [Pleurodeles waltl]|uniref:Uncharacterized protein n=1 Tax=Pleurodeles waltl TaxID=8319 RepID=A0AAV7QR52_PLEWA|nr:hypothetical protein NDU88_008912 [Pleurodeles waltl]